jgi:hypothetical protein
MTSPQAITRIDNNNRFKGVSFQVRVIILTIFKKGAIRMEIRPVSTSLLMYVDFSVRQPFLQFGFLLGLVHIIFDGVIYFRQFDCHLVDFSGELKWHLIGVSYRRALI